MIKKLLLVFAFLVIAKSYGQLQGFWFLQTFENPDGDVVVVSNIKPYFTSYIDFDHFGNFTGMAVCNEFEGKITYDPATLSTVLESFVITTNHICEFQSHINFESEYFSQFENSVSEEIYASRLYFSGYEEIEIIFPGNVRYRYGEQPLLSQDELAIQNIIISPNPASDYITIKADTPIEHVNIYGIAGNVLFSEVNPSQTVNISALTAGIYFVEVIANNHRNIQKLIKK